MSDIYIRGMEMPKNCYGCCFFHQVDYWNRDNEADILSFCKRTGEKTFDDFIKYLPNCPLVPVPPHGRLIDAGRLKIEVFAHAKLMKDGWNNMDMGMFTENLMEVIDNTPTVIDAKDGVL